METVAQKCIGENLIQSNGDRYYVDDNSEDNDDDKKNDNNDNNSDDEDNHNINKNIVLL